MRVTIEDVAKKANVSKTTVSRIVNGNYAHTTEETRQRVLNAIKELNYRPNALAKGLKSAKTNVIGIILSNLKNPFWTTVLEGVEDTCRELGYNLMICNSNEEADSEKEYIKELQMKQVDGMIINPTVKNQAIYEELVKDDYPLVVINRRIPSLQAQHIIMNNEKGAYMAVEHFLQNGRKNIAICVYKNPLVSTWNERSEGYKLALLRNGFSDKEFKILELEQGAQQLKKAVKTFMKDNPKIDALFSTNNMMTLYLLEAFKELDIKVPEDIAIVSYDEMVWSKHIDPPLTTISQPGYYMGQLAAQLLIKRIKNTNTVDIKPSTIVLEPELIVRGSSGA